MTTTHLRQGGGLPQHRMRPDGTRQQQDRAANMGARFLPQRNDDELPAIDVAGVLASVYVKDGELHVGIDLDTADPAIYRIYGDQQIPLHITVQGSPVFEATDPATSASPFTSTRIPEARERASVRQDAGPAEERQR